jgi:hypothetical protein
MGAIVTNRTNSASGNQYQEHNVTIPPADPWYTLEPGLEYLFKLSAEDAAGNEPCAIRFDIS